MFNINVPRDELKKWPLLAKYFDNENLARLKCFKSLVVRLFAITHDDVVIAVGDNSDGQLGVGHREQVETFVEIEELRGQHVQDIQAGMKHVWALTEMGRVWGWGVTKCGELGLGLGVKYALRPTIVIDKDIVAIALGCWHSMALSSDGKVLACGWNSDGRVGLKYVYKVWTPMQICLPEEVNIIKIACGSWHSMALCDQGRLYLWGHNKHHQIEEITEPVLTPTLANLDNFPTISIAEISGTSSRSLMLTKKGKLISRGGNDKSNFRLLNPTDIVFKKIMSINYYLLHEGNFKQLHIAVSENESQTNQCYVWGNVLNEEKEWLDPVKIEHNLSNISQVILRYSCHLGFTEQMLVIE